MSVVFFLLMLTKLTEKLWLYNITINFSSPQEGELYYVIIYIFLAYVWSSASAVHSCLYITAYPLRATQTLPQKYSPWS